MNRRNLSVKSANKLPSLYKLYIDTENLFRLHNIVLLTWQISSRIPTGRPPTHLRSHLINFYSYIYISRLFIYCNARIYSFVDVIVLSQYFLLYITYVTYPCLSFVRMTRQGIVSKLLFKCWSPLWQFFVSWTRQKNH